MFANINLHVEYLKYSETFFGEGFEKKTSNFCIPNRDKRIEFYMLLLLLLHIMRRIHETWLFLASSQLIKKTDIGDQSFSTKPHILTKSK